MDIPKAFVMRLPFGTADDKLEKIKQWGSKNFVRFKVSSNYERDLVVAGGFFDPRRAPKSFATFRSLVITNLKNWKVDRPHYERGWLAFVKPADWELEVKTKEEVKEEARSLVQGAVAVATRRIQRLVDARNGRIHRATGLLQGILDRRRQAGVDALAVEARQRRAALEEARAAKKRAFNSERFNLPDSRVSYSAEEMDECQTWQDVKRRRREHPQAAWKEREDARIAQIDRDLELSAQGRALLAPR
jgi:hypothetical protein